MHERRHLQDQSALTMIPNSSFALDARCVGKRTSAGMSREAFATVTYPGLTEVTDCTLRTSPHSGSMYYSKNNRARKHNGTIVSFGI